MRWTVFLIVVLSLMAGCVEEKKIVNNKTLSDTVLVPATIHEEGWSTPVKLGFNDDGWEDSPYLTRDGSQVLFFWHPWTNLTDPESSMKLTEYVVSHQREAIEQDLDGKIWVSKKPFNTKRIHPISENKKYPEATAAPYISESGDLYYTSNLESYIQGKSVPVTVYKNGERLDFGTGGEEGNPHYCEAMDEMWFDCPGDQNLCVIKNYSTNGTYELAPSPINLEGVNDFQAFLTDDCKTLYFSSDRNGKIAVYRTRREGSEWAEPELFLSHPVGVAEISMTSDGRAMAFIQLSKGKNGGFKSDVWYAEKT